MASLRDSLELLSRNLWWTWDTEATSLFSEIEPGVWDTNRHNPVALLAGLDAEAWERLEAQAPLRARVDAVLQRLAAYLDGPSWCAEHAPSVHAGGVLYLSMEFGLHESLRIYSGGLGVLAGDHLKSASDLGVPLTAVGLYYRHGYFRQVIDDGEQLAAYPVARPERLPIEQVLDRQGKPLYIPVPIAHHVTRARVWRVRVGRVDLYLLDTDHDANNELDRTLCTQLYGGDSETRIRQEVLLGIGGLRLAKALALKPAIVHMNEGHCGFAVLELAAEAMDGGLGFDAAIAAGRERLVFTTHTPVPAGHDRFGWDITERVLGPWRRQLRLPDGAFMDLGRVRPGDTDESLCMTVLALRGSGKSNGVSALHGEVSREMWREMWPGRPPSQVPIGHVTNGVHPVYWAAPASRAFFDRFVPAWRDRPWDAQIWEAILSVPDEAIVSWRTTLRTALVERLRRVGRRFDPNALTIGFARRFAPYKRGDLIFSDPDRIEALLHEHPVQLVFSGKAHPADTEGKAVVARVIRWANDARFRDRVAFLEDYDMSIGALLTAGCDVWLNNPRRPQEASGTSGQKVLLNGGLNLSVQDGWWAEGFDGTNGWTIGPNDQDPDPDLQDASDRAALYAALQDEVVPEWEAPARWLQRVRRSILTGVPRFNSHRMVRDYVLDLYEPLASARATAAAAV